MEIIRIKIDNLDPKKLTLEYTVPSRSEGMPESSPVFMYSSNRCFNSLMTLITAQLLYPFQTWWSALTRDGLHSQPLQLQAYEAVLDPQSRCPCSCIRVFQPWVHIVARIQYIIKKHKAAGKRAHAEECSKQLRYNFVIGEHTIKPSNLVPDALPN